MRIPLSWLKDYVDVDVPAQDLADRLTGAGVPVEAVEYISPDVTEVYVGLIKKIRPHPNADKLVLCDVDLGDRTLQIVTGAPNVKEGRKAPTALHGARLKGGLKIKRSKIRGEESHGMMCSAAELGIDIKDLPVEQREGVLILPDDTPAGESVIDLYCLHDAVLVLETFANRPDQLSILGVAREAAAVLGKKVKYPSLEYAETGENAAGKLDVEIGNYDLCKKYSGRIIKSVPIKSAPLWMQGRLYAAGVRSVNNVVDVTNYVMIETGQPLHAFDYDKVKGQKIIVRPAKDGEKLKTIDGEERKLDPSMLAICDEDAPVALAGVMGGFDSEVSDDTGTILLEAANFNGASIRRTSIKLGLRSESSRRFEKGIDYFRVDFASRRACHFLEKLGGKVLKGEAVDAVPAPEPTVITLRPKRVNRILGADLSRETIGKLLSGLDFDLEDKGGNFKVTVPKVRKDINAEIDLVEEVARLYGYDNIPATEPVGVAKGGIEPARVFDHYLRELLVRCGLNECITLALHEEGVLDTFKINGSDLLRVKNPITGDQAVMRADAAPHMLEVIKRNFAAQRNKSTLFEISNFYKIGKDGEVKERREATIVLTGPEGDEETDFFALKGVVEFICSHLGVDVEFQRDMLPYLHPNKTAKVMAGDVKLGVLGVLHPRIAHSIDVDQEVVIARLFIDEIRPLVKVKRYKPLPKFPGVRRDVALVMDEKIPSADVRNLIMQRGRPLVDDAHCFDVYKGDQVEEGRKSLAFSIAFSAPDRTLTDKEVQKKIDSILYCLEKEMNATLRG